MHNCTVRFPLQQGRKKECLKHVQIGFCERWTVNSRGTVGGYEELGTVKQNRESERE